MLLHALPPKFLIIFRQMAALIYHEITLNIVKAKLPVTLLKVDSRNTLFNIYDRLDSIKITFNICDCVFWNVTIHVQIVIYFSGIQQRKLKRPLIMKVHGII